MSDTKPSRRAERDAILALFDNEMRADPPPEPGLSWTRANGIVRSSGSSCCIVFADLAPPAVDAAIATQAALHRDTGQALEWKVYGHDRLPDLGRNLAAHDFVADPSETLMIFDLAAGAPRSPHAPDIAIRRVADAAGLDDFIAVNDAAFGRDDTWMRAAYGSRLDDPTLALHVAYDDGRPVAGGRIDLPPDRAFAGLWGGGTLPAARGRGIYRALVTARGEAARQRGYRYLTVEARDTSRPILERLGFLALTTVTGWVLQPG